jgi:hypothetical protein
VPSGPRRRARKPAVVARERRPEMAAHDAPRAIATPGLSLAIVAAVFLCFFPALRSGFVSWDDPMNLTDNAAYRGLSATHLRWMFTTTHGGQYKPLTWLTSASTTRSGRRTRPGIT